MHGSIIVFFQPCVLSYPLSAIHTLYPLPAMPQKKYDVKEINNISGWNMANNFCTCTFLYMCYL